MIAGRMWYAVMAALVLLAIGGRIAAEFFAGPASILRSLPMTQVVLLYAVIVLIPIVGPRLPKRIWGPLRTTPGDRSCGPQSARPAATRCDVKREDDGCTICPECARRGSCSMDHQHCLLAMACSTVIDLHRNRSIAS